MFGKDFNDLSIHRLQSRAHLTLYFHVLYPSNSHIWMGKQSCMDDGTYQRVSYEGLELLWIYLPGCDYKGSYLREKQDRTRDSQHRQLTSKHGRCSVIAYVTNSLNSEIRVLNLTWMSFSDCLTKTLSDSSASFFSSAHLNMASSSKMSLSYKICKIWEKIIWSDQQHDKQQFTFTYWSINKDLFFGSRPGYQKLLLHRDQ